MFIAIAPVNRAPSFRYARIGGALYLVIIAAGIVGPLLTHAQLIVTGDADATAHNIAASPVLWRLGIAMNVVMQLCDVPVMLILFLLLSPVNKNIALLALLFNIVQTATLVANQLTLVAAELFSADLPALTDVAIRAYSFGESLGLVFFGFTLLSVGYLIRHSGFLPWLLGLMVQIAGACYIVNSLLLLILPEIEVANIALLVPIFVAELSLALWLLVKGVDAPQARGTETSPKVVAAPPKGGHRPADASSFDIATQTFRRCASRVFEAKVETPAPKPSPSTNPRRALP